MYSVQYGNRTIEYSILEKDGLKSIHPRLSIRNVEVFWAARKEMARSVEDVLARRTRSLLLDAAASVECAPKVAEILSLELGKTKAWQKAQVSAYKKLASQYML